MKSLKYLKPHLLYALLAPVLMIIEVVSELQLPNIMSDVIDNGVAANDVSFIIKKGIVMLMISVLGVIGGVGSAYFASKASVYFAADLRRAIFKKIQCFSFANLDKFHTSSLITRLTNDVTQIQNVVMICIRMLFRSPILFLGSMYMAFNISTDLTIIVFIAIFIMFFIVMFIFKKTFPLFDKVQKSVDTINTIMRENLSGIRVIKAFVRQKKEKEKFDMANNLLKLCSINAFKVMSLMIPFMTIVLNFSMIGVLSVAGVYVKGGRLSAGNLMEYITYLTQILMSFLMSAMLILNISRAKVSFDRIDEILDEKADIENIENPVTHIDNFDISFKNVSFNYPDSTAENVLSDISLNIKQGQSIGVLGQTGSGKTTLVNLINRMYDVTQGEITIGGVNVKNIDLEYLRKNIGICLQKAILFSGTIRQNLLWGNENATEDELTDALKISNSYDFVFNMEDKMDTKLEQMAVNLSGGQKQRLSIARTILKKPKILIFDDSTSAVDVTTENNIRRQLMNYLPDVTKIIIAQKISSVINLDKIVVLSDGKISAYGSHDELIKTSDIYREIYNSQIIKEDD